MRLTPARASSVNCMPLKYPFVHTLVIVIPDLYLPQEEAAWASVPYNYGPACRRRHTSRIAEDVAQRLTHPFPSEAYSAQLWAARLHNCLGRLSRIKVQAMIVHGRHDRLIPVANADLIAGRMPHARLEILEHSGHLYPTEQPDIDEQISAFIAGCERSDAPG